MTSNPPANFRQRVLKAGVWTVCGYVLSMAIRFGSNLLLTRLLLPEMFGVMAIASTVMYGLALISDVGLAPSLIHSKRGADPVFLNTAWAIQIRRGLLIWFVALAVGLLIWFGSSISIFPADSVYANRLLPYVIAALAFSAIIEGFESTKTLEARRNLATGLLTRMELTSQVVGLLCLLVWVAIDRSIWALVAGALSASLARMIQSYVLLPGHSNRWQWDDSAFREIIHFGKWVFLSSILGFLVNSGDRILLGGLLSTRVLGLYATAGLIIASVENLAAKVFTDVSFPALSEVARLRPADFKAKYYRFHVPGSVFIYFSAGALMTSGRALIHVLYDPRYAQAGDMLEVLATGLLTIPCRILHQCFQALGRPGYLSGIIAIRLVALLVLTPLGFHYFGLTGALWGIVISAFCSLPPTFYYAVAHDLIDLRKELLLLAAIPAGMLCGELISGVLSHVHSIRHFHHG